MMKTVLRCTVVYVVTGKKSCYAIRQDVVGEYLYDEDGAQMYCCICCDGGRSHVMRYVRMLSVSIYMMKTVLRCIGVYVVTGKKSCYVIRQDR